MKYPLLSKIYYKDRESYGKAYEERYHSAAAYRLPITLKAGPAFVLSTMELSQKIEKLLINSAKLQALLKELPSVAIRQFLYSCIVDEIQQTNEIEGVRSTRREISQVLQNTDPNKPLRFQGLVKKYDRLMDLENEIPLENCQDIRNLYDEIVLSEVLEEYPENQPDGKVFRSSPVSVVSGSFGTHEKELHRGLSSEEEIMSTMEAALALLHEEELPELVRISVFHYLFGYIHPFYDGNGRMARFISSYQISSIVQPLIALRLSYTVKNYDCKKYYHAFETCNDPKNKGDLTPFVLAFLDILLKACQNLMTELTDIHKKLDFYSEQIYEKFHMLPAKEQSLLFILVQNHIFTDERMTAKELADAIKKSLPWAQKRLKQFEEQGLVTHTRQGHKVVYHIILDALE